MKKRGKTLIIILTIILILFIIRLISPTEIDDVSPNISCPEIKNYNPDVLYIIPNFNNNQISENKTWCNEILKLNKKIEMHGINHEPYREFLYENITEEQMNFSLNEFQNCFNTTPEKFKPPQLKINPENKKLVKENNLKLQTWFNQLTKKVYHCNNGGRLPNWLIEII